MMNYKKKIFVFCVTVMSCICMLCGCGRDAALDEYKDKMEQYYANTAVLNTYINDINPDTDVDGRQLLGYLDQLETLTTEMAEFTVPEQFSIVESLADEAAQNMTSAVSLYHQFYEGEPDVNISDAAYEYYLRANKRIVYIRSILQGDMPEELVAVDENGETQTTEDSLLEQIPQEDTSNVSPDDSGVTDGAADNFDTDDTVFYEGE